MAQPAWRKFPVAARWLAWTWVAWALALWAVMLWLGPAESAVRLMDGPLFIDYDVYREQLLRFERNEALVSSRWYYPPFAAVLFWPLRWLSRDVGALCWAGLEAIALLALIRMCWSLLEGWPRWPRLAAALGLVLASYPVCCCLAFGQIGILITVLALWSLSDPRRSQGWLAAAGALKVYPLLYALGSAVRMDLKLLARLGAWLFLLGLVVPLCWLGPSACWELFQGTLSVVLRTRGPRFDAEQTLDGVFMRLFYARSLFDSEPRALLVDMPLPLVIGLSILSTAALPAYALWRTRSRSASDPLVISAVLIACCLLIKPGWVHYWIALPYAQATLLSRAQHGRELSVCALSVALSAFPLCRVLQPRAAEWLELWGVFPVSGLCVLFGLCELAARSDPLQADPKGVCDAMRDPRAGLLR